MVALNTNVINFPERHRGKIVGGLNCFFAGSPSIFSVIYYQMIQKNGEYAESFGNFMIFFAILFGIIDIICALFLRVYKKTEEVYTVDPSDFRDPESNGETQMQNIAGNESPNEKSCCAPPTSLLIEPKSLKEILTDLDFYLLIGMFSCASAVGLLYLNNLTVISKSVHLDGNDHNLVLIVPITNAIISVSIGFASDFFQEKIQRLVIVVLTCILYIGLSIITMLLGDNYAALCFATFLCGLGTGTIWSLTPTVMSEIFHISNLGRNWGIALLFAALVGLGGQYSFGALYDEMKTEGELFCHGLKCVSGGLGVCVGLSVLALIFGAILMLHRRFRISKESN
jgi:MFS family permease